MRGLFIAIAGVFAYLCYGVFFSQYDLRIIPKGSSLPITHRDFTTIKGSRTSRRL